jgi:hypothetical protein
MPLIPSPLSSALQLGGSPVSLPWGAVPMGDSPGTLRRLAANPGDLSLTTNWVSGKRRALLGAPQNSNAFALACEGYALGR